MVGCDESKSYKYKSNNNEQNGTTMQNNGKKKPAEENIHMNEYVLDSLIFPFWIRSFHVTFFLSEANKIFSRLCHERGESLLLCTHLS